MGLSKKIVDAFKGFLPAISQTEKEALESGTVGWDGELMKGTPDWDVLFKMPKPQLTEEELAFLNGPVEELCKMIDNYQVSKDGDLPREVWDFIKKEGFMGLEIPKEFGGHGFSSAAHSAVVIKVASRSIAAAVTVMVPNSLGPAELIHSYGTQAQKDYYLPRLADGREVPCFALTEPDAGSDAGNMGARGVVVKNDKGELGIRLNWEKRYITLGPVSTLLGLAFKLEDPDNLLGKDKKDMGITCALIPSNTPGVTIGDRHAPMDLPFHNGPNFGKDVFIPLENIIGGPERAGQGWKMLMESLAVGRSLSLPALSTAGAQLSSFASGAYARTRKQFNTAISNFEGIEEPLGKMAGLTYMMNAAREATLQMVDSGERPAIPSAILKYHLTESMRTIVNDAMDIHGGKAVSNGPKNTFADLYKGIPIAITVEGANIMTRNLIIFGQGAVRAHPYVLKELQAVEEPNENKALGKLAKTLAAHVGNGLRSFAKSFVYGITGGAFSKKPKGVDKKTKKYYNQINRLSASFNLAAEATLATLGGGLKMKERVSARLGDVYSNLYLASTVLWYYEKNGQKKEDLPLVNWACQHALNNAEKALDQALKNHPAASFRQSVGEGLDTSKKMMNKALERHNIPGIVLASLGSGMTLVMSVVKPVIMKALPLFIFPRMAVPFLDKYQTAAPSDQLDKLAADTIRNPGEIRDRLTSGIFKPTGENEPLGRLEAAFKSVVESEPLEKKLYKAQKARTLQKDTGRAALLDAAVAANVLTSDEADLLKRTDKLRSAVVEVDAFPQTKVSGAVAANDDKNEKPAAKPAQNAVPKGPGAA